MRSETIRERDITEGKCIVLSFSSRRPPKHQSLTRNTRQVPRAATSLLQRRRRRPRRSAGRSTTSRGGNTRGKGGLGPKFGEGGKASERTRRGWKEQSRRRLARFSSAFTPQSGAGLRLSWVRVRVIAFSSAILPCSHPGLLCIIFQRGR